ncbi:MAG: KaiC domain-containing protein [Nitrospirae bacterium]|nr:MAG: KaiC domain-containing protein [Nitrospirota bacterium]
MNEAHPVVTDSICTLSEAASKAPELRGVTSGVPGLDELFYVTRFVDGKPRKVPLGGYPSYAVINITGVSDTGKSLMAEQFLVTQAALGHPVCLITLESPAPFVATSLKERAAALGIEARSIDKQVLIIDAATHTPLREDLLSLFNTLAYTIKQHKVTCTVVDSITGFFEEREMLARGVVRRFFHFLKKWHQTALLISQKRSGHEELSAEAAGGYAVSHIVDGSLVLSKVAITTRVEARQYGRAIGELVRLFRIDGCRLCGHNVHTHVMDITDTGVVRIGPPLSKLVGTTTDESGGMRWRP